MRRTAKGGWGMSGSDAPFAPGAVCGFYFSGDAQLVVSVDPPFDGLGGLVIDGEGELDDASPVTLASHTTRVLLPS